MPNASPAQTSFLGGEWSEFAQGRTDHPKYKTALARSLNGMPLEEGAWSRRSGTMRIIPTHYRKEAALRLFSSSAACSFAMEFSYQNLRFYSGGQPVFDSTTRTVSAASLSAGIITLTTSAVHGWSTGDCIMLDMSALDPTLQGGCRGRVLRLMSTPTTTTMTLKNDDSSLLVLPTWIGSDLVGATAMRIKDIVAPYESDFDKIRVVQEQNNAIILHPDWAPYKLTVTEPVAGADPVFTFAAVTFIDGPYLDPQGGPTSPEGGTVSGYSGSINFTPATTTPSSADIGRLIRVFTQPAAWASGTTYAYGDTVTYNNQYWMAINRGATAAVNVGIAPGTMYTDASSVQSTLWGPAVNAATWGWGQISAVAGGHYTFTLQSNLNSANGATVTMWQLGTHRAGHFPICGIYHQGRLWLGGAEPNRFDASVSNDPFVFSYTDFYDVVNDNSAISYTLNSNDINNIIWMALDHEGILCGTITAEFLIAASQGDILTPTSIDANEVTRYGSRPDVEPRRVGMVLATVQRYGRVVYEYMADAFSGRYTAKPLNELAKHFAKRGIKEIAYQETPTPLLWHRTDDGRLITSTYRRTSRFVTEDPVFNGWAQHLHGAPAGFFPVESMVMVPSEDGLSDRLYMVVNENDGTGKNQRYVEVMQLLPDPSNPGADD
jgi:hypothetical protein